MTHALFVVGWVICGILGYALIKGLYTYNNNPSTKYDIMIIEFGAIFYGFIFGYLGLISAIISSLILERKLHFRLRYG